jgi:type IV secretion system protein VirB9
MNKILGCLTFVLSLLSSAAFSQENPASMQTDSRIKVVSYIPYQVVKINNNFGYSTVVSFDDDEHLPEAFTLGDTGSWQVKNLGDKLVINAIAEKPMPTNLVFKTNKHLYTFLLSDGGTQNPDKQTFRVIFKYADTAHTNNYWEQYQTQNQTLENFGDLTHINRNYTINRTCSKTIAPILAQDNGKFTLLQFAENGTIPAISYVDNESHVLPINYRVVGDYIEIENIYPQYQLKLGNLECCLFNEKALKQID